MKKDFIVNSIEDIKNAISSVMNDQGNSRKQVYTATIQCYGNTLIVCPDSEYYNTPTPTADSHGLRSIRRNYWNCWPGYAERICKKLYGLMTGQHIS